MPMYFHHYTVEGSTPFPIDMLRYDHSYPANVAASTTIDKLYNRLEGRHQLALSAVTDNKTWVPTTGRWRSFGWDVLPDVETVRY